jgi:hypothetical protein
VGDVPPATDCSSGFASAATKIDPVAIKLHESVMIDSGSNQVREQQAIKREYLIGARDV